MEESDAYPTSMEVAEEAEEKTGSDDPMKPSYIPDLCHTLDRATVAKESGNALFKGNRFSEGIEAYEVALQIIERYTGSCGGLCDGNLLRLKLVCLLNAAACCIKMENGDLALGYCNRALEEAELLSCHDLYVKALFRKAQGLRMCGDYRRARRVLLEAYQESPNDKSIQGELTLLNGGVTFVPPPKRPKGQIFSGLFSRMKEAEEKDEILLRSEQKRIQQELLCSGRFGGQPSTVNSLKMLRQREITGRASHRDRIAATYHLLPNSAPAPIDMYRRRAYSGMYNTDGSLFYTASQDWNIRVYKSGPQGVGLTKQHIIKAKKGQWTITDTCISQDSASLIYSSITPIVHHVDLRTVQELNSSEVVHHAFDFAKWRVFGSFGLWSVRLSGDGREIVAGSSDNALYVYDIETDKVLLRVQGHSDDVNSVTFADVSHSNLIFSGSDDCHIRVWDRRCLNASTSSTTPPSSGGSVKPAGVFVGHTEGVTHVDSKGDGVYLVSNSKDQTAKLWDLRSMSRPDDAPAVPKKYNWDYRGMNYPGDPIVDRHPHDKSLVTFRGHKVLRTLIRVRFSPQSSTGQRYVYTGSADGTVYIYDLSGDIVQILDPHSTMSNPVIRDAHWHPYGPVLTTTAWDGTISQFTYVGERGLLQDPPTTTTTTDKN
eukprot:TRINITY_DN116_c1_g2_i3.p1 TRINITY_DN116_c1_g2~~TRINITY_DN116_c1_g2_i3.p1  ORF type:complete len:657 (+),score=79.47 TRINITY_DN116_c1_g2_i3:125-2095(+)